MNIAFIVLKGFPFGGGIEKFTEEVGSRLVSRGHKVSVFVINIDKSSSSFYRGMRILPTWSLHLRFLEKISAAFFATLKACFIRDIEVVHFHAFGAAAFCFLPKLFGKKDIVQGHGIEWKRSRWSFIIKFFLKITEVFSVRLAHSITVVSRVQQQYLRDKYGKESLYIPTGVSVPDAQEPELIKRFGLKGNDYILFAGRLVQEKGAHYLIEAFKKLKSNLKLVIAGDAEYEKAYKSRIYKIAQGNSNIIFTGFASGRLLKELLSNCYLFVLPSELEGLSTVLLEAMSYGNCCVTSDIQENIEPLNGLGFTFKNGDVDDLARKMQYLVENKELVHIVKSKSKDYVLQNYSWDKITQQIEDLYKSVLT